MKKIPVYFLLILLIFSACNTPGRGIFAKKTARETYQDRILKTESAEVLAWKRAGEKVLQNPLMVPAPYAENGIFTGDSSDANSFLFTSDPGQKIKVSLSPVTGEIFIAFLELWDANNGAPKLIEAADTLTNMIEFSAPTGGNFIVRLQPKLSARGRFSLTIALNPIVGFPISPTVKSSIGSFWGDPRDAGVRKHEGIDIFAKKGSPAVAVSNGLVSSVNEGGIGGKVIWLNPDGESFSVYYAHLDTQYVQAGQRVTKGQVLGTVGNTGNAKFTAAHLHFGIYTGNGAVDPIGFVRPVKEAALVSGRKLNEWYKTNAKTKIYPSPIKKNAFALAAPVKIKTVSASSDFYKVVLENGHKGFVAVNELTDKMKL
ncbi:MAG: M23 family metallopeptidase [Rhizobacter sp.]|nr:M23 family metallopeptidase [Ferruginibacter sp.]